MRFLHTYRFPKRLIKLCYVKIGWLVTGGDLLYFSQYKSHEGLADGVGKGREQEKEIERPKYIVLSIPVGGL